MCLKKDLLIINFLRKKPLFEESIYLFEIDLHKKEKQEILVEIKKLLEKVELTYKNENGEDISWKIYKIIDMFDNIYDLKVFEFPNEVYSQHLELPLGSDHQDILQIFYSDYVWKDN